MLKIALPNKGRLVDDMRELFAEAGLPVRASSERALTASIGGEFQAIFVRAADIPELVERGAANVGVTGWDLVRESGLALETLLDLGFGRCRLSVASREDSAFGPVGSWPDGVRVATTFPRLAREFFDRHGKAVTVVPVSGAAEVAPHLGIADVIVDLVSSGSTLKTNGLVEREPILESTARLIARADAARAPAEQQSLDELVTALTSVLRARGKRYLMTNAPRAALDAVREVLPGINGPTVIDLFREGARDRSPTELVAVHAVIDASQVYRTINRLKELGCEGILVTRIERLLP
jgi:ATP phosphoribosyltransferase